MIKRLNVRISLVYVAAQLDLMVPTMCVNTTRLKWVCIILGVLDENRLKRMVASHGSLDVDELAIKRLITAQSLLAQTSY